MHIAAVIEVALAVVGDGKQRLVGHLVVFAGVFEVGVPVAVLVPKSDASAVGGYREESVGAFGDAAYPA